MTVIIGVAFGTYPTAPNKTQAQRVAERRRRNDKSGAIMSGGKADEAKGRLKEAGGDLTGDKSLKREGKVDRATGTVKDRADKASDKVKDAVRKD